MISTLMALVNAGTNQLYLPVGAGAAGAVAAGVAGFSGTNINFIRLLPLRYLLAASLVLCAVTVFRSLT